MIRVADIAGKQLINSLRYGFAGLSFGKKRTPTKSDLGKYDVVIVGGNLGSVLSTHLDAVLKEKAKIFVSYDNPSNHFYVQRGLYEQGKTTKVDMNTTVKNSISKNNAHSENVGVERINPDKNEVVLRNGRTIAYDNLVIAVGQKENHQSIKGFEDAWSDPEHPFHTNADHPSWRGGINKPFRYHYNFNGGEAFYYIPPEPFFGQIENYNFFLSKTLWDWHAGHGKISWDSSRFTIVNANDSFVRYFPKADEYIRTQAERRGIHVQQGLKLVEVKKDARIAVFQDMQTGQFVEKIYGNFFSMMPAKPNPLVSQSGLADQSGYLDVDNHTLQHNKYGNIFGLGDVNSIPTTKTFYGGLEQVHVLRNNLERRINGLSMNARYNGHAEAPLFLSPSNLTWVAHEYDGREVSFDTNSLSSALRYKKYTMFDKKDVANLYKFKNWGPPYYKVKKTFTDSTGTGASSVASAVASKLRPDKKSA